MRTYGPLFRLPGARAFVVAGFVGRFPMSMRSLGCLLMISLLTGSYALAGGVTAALTLAQAVAAPVLGRAADRHGQRTVIPVTLTAHGCGMAALIVLATQGRPAWALVGAAVLAGGSALPLGSLVRTRWTALVGGTPQLSAAFALESVLDEAIFVLGPVLVTALAVGLFPAAGLAGALLLTAMGSLGLAAARRTEPPRSRTMERGRREALLRTRGVATLLTVHAALGVFLGAVDVGIVAFATERGSAGAAGVLLALVAVGSLAAGLVYGGVRSWRFALPERFLLLAIALCLLSVPLVFARTIPVMALSAVLAGMAVSPMLISGNALVESLARRTKLTEGFSWLSSAVTVGMAAGTAAAGFLVDAGSSRSALVCAVLSAAVAAIAAAAGRRRLRVAAQPQPPMSWPA
ncbi:MFS transporter [Streptomyces gobiensis]|uniref:MFS transporter n=1 Tax=Streptomyces gobiensis TaxID=2875706 RepID=UPI001E37596B|nr:MFS transporter [Streptomyces gobiensis]UGY94834.1 MFS transporter [Streptomyces gobiensis]